MFYLAIVFSFLFFFGVLGIYTYGWLMFLLLAIVVTAFAGRFIKEGTSTHY